MFAALPLARSAVAGLRCGGSVVQRRHASLLRGCPVIPTAQATDANVGKTASPKLSYVLNGTAGFTPAAHHPPANDPAWNAPTTWTFAELDRMVVEANKLLTSVYQEEVRAAVGGPPVERRRRISRDVRQVKSRTGKD